MFEIDEEMLALLFAPRPPSVSDDILRQISDVGGQNALDTFTDCEAIVGDHSLPEEQRASAITSAQMVSESLRSRGYPDDELVIEPVVIDDLTLSEATAFAQRCRVVATPQQLHEALITLELRLRRTPDTASISGPLLLTILRQLGATRTD